MTDENRFPCSVTGARIARAHVAYLDGDTETARDEVFATFETDRFAPEVWDAFARLCAETDFDPAEVVARVPDDRTFEVITALRVIPGSIHGADPFGQALHEAVPFTMNCR